VNRDFGSIFSTLLPGARAKLSPVDGKSVLDGLEVKVAFGDVWKENLTELSGGQRFVYFDRISVELVAYFYVSLCYNRIHESCS